MSTKFLSIKRNYKEESLYEKNRKDSLVLVAEAGLEPTTFGL